PASAPSAPGQPASTPPASVRGTRRAKTARLTPPTRSSPIVLLSRGPPQGAHQVPSPRGDAHGNPDQCEPGGASKPPIDVVTAYRRAGRSYYERQADARERQERPPRRRLRCHHASINARPPASCE